MPYADLVWFRNFYTPDLEEARKFAVAIHAQYPGKLLAYNCSPSFNWAVCIISCKNGNIP